MSNIENRKYDHIRLTIERNVESRETTLLEYVRIVHNPLPEVNISDITLETDFCGRRLRAPLMITGMTGGFEEAYRINAELARIAEKYGLAMGVGSQRAGLEKPSLARTYSVVRREAPNAFIIANLGAPQLVLGYGFEDAKKAVEMIEADAVAIHLNVGQELYQYEGDPYYRGVLDKIIEISEQLGVPVIVKETGQGLSRESVRILYNLGIKCFDVAGLGGTSWIKVEGIRGLGRDDYIPPGPLGDYWGNPTAVSIVESRVAAPAAYIVASGGIRSGLDVGRALALGADVGGMALPFLRILLKSGFAGLDKFVRNILYQLKSIIMMVGGRSPKDLWRARIVVHSRLREELECAGIELQDYLVRRRLLPLVERKW